MDDKLRDLERKANETGAPEDYAGFAVGLQRAGRRDEGIGILVDLFQQNPENSVVKSAWISNFGLPFVEVSPLDAVDAVRWYNVLHKGVNGAERVPYVFTWDKYFFSHQRRDSVWNSLDCFSQDRLASILNDEKISKRPLTAGAVHSHVLALEEMLRLGVPSAQVQLARGFLKQYLEQWPLTWTKVDCDSRTVIQDLDYSNVTVAVDIRGEHGYLRDLNTGENGLGDLIKNSVLCAEQSVAEIDRMYNFLLSVSQGAYAYLPDNTAIGKRAVVLGRNGFYVSRFSIGCGSVSNRPARLVVTSAKKLSLLK